MMKSAALLALITLITLGSADFLRKIAVQRGVDTFSFVFLEAGFVILWGGIAVLVSRYTLQIQPQMIGLAAINGLLVVVGVNALLLALERGDASRAVPIGRLGLILTAVLAVIILREPLTVSKLLGLGCGVLAVILLSQ